ncbi:hypothetical protein BG004_008476 [Podila humilis]|nr:hypothetical protein BG004_008476 [Podila humilis]
MAPFFRLTTVALLFASVLVQAVPVLPPVSSTGGAPALNTDGAFGSGPSTTDQKLEKRASASVISKCKKPGQIAITFDDGPAQFTSGLLKQLRGLNAKVTFFVNGNNYGSIYQYADVVKQAVADGHQIASHTWSHADLTKLSDAGIASEMTQVDKALLKIIKKRPTFMRPPYGAYNSDVLRVLGDMGYRVIYWNIDTEDFSHPNDVEKSMAQYRSALGKSSSLKNSFISLQHDPNEMTAKQLGPKAVKYALQRGFKVVTVGECLGVPSSQWYRK